MGCGFPGLLRLGKLKESMPHELVVNNCVMLNN